MNVLYNVGVLFYSALLPALIPSISASLGIKLRIFGHNSGILKGFVMASSMPASMACCICSLRAFALTARIGILSIPRSARAPEFWVGMIEGNGECAWVSGRSGGSARRPFCSSARMRRAQVRPSLEYHVSEKVRYERCAVENGHMFDTQLREAFTMPREFKRSLA
jgi:hypothetical protein